jgi:hypothetical protein
MTRSIYATQLGEDFTPRKPLPSQELRVHMQRLVVGDQMQKLHEGVPLCGQKVAKLSDDYSKVTCVACLHIFIKKGRKS